MHDNMGVTSISNRGGIRPSMPSNGVELVPTGADDKYEDKEIQLSLRRESERENADGAGLTKPVVEGSASWSVVTSVASYLGWHQRPLLWLIIAILAARVFSLWTNYVLLQTAGFGPDNTTLPLYSDWMRCFNSGAVTVVMFICHKAMGRPLWPVGSPYLYAGAAGALSLTAVSLRELDASVGVGITSILRIFVLPSILAWQALFTGSPFLAGACSSSSSGGGSAAASAVAFKRIHWLLSAAFLAACIWSFVPWVIDPPWSMSSRMLLGAVPSKPLLLPPHSLSSFNATTNGTTVNSSASGNSSMAAAAAAATAVGSASAESLASTSQPVVLSVALFAVVLIGADGLGAALQERLYVVYETPITDNLLFIFATSFLIELLGFLLGEHAPQVIGFIIDNPLVILHLVLTSLTVVLVIFLTSAMLRQCGAVLCFMIYRIVLLLLIIPLEHFSPFWTLIVQLAGLVCMCLVMARMAGEAERRKDYMILPDAQGGEGRGEGGGCRDGGHNHVEVQVSTHSASLSSNVIQTSSNRADTGSMRTIRDQGGRLSLHTDDVVGRAAQTLSPLSQFNGNNATTTTTTSSSSSSSSSSGTISSCDERGPALPVQAPPVAVGGNSISNRVTNASVFPSPLAQGSGSRSSAVASSPLILAHGSRRVGSASVVSSHMQSDSGQRSGK